MGRTNDNDPRVTFNTVVPWILVSATQLGFPIITGLPSGMTKGIFAVSHPSSTTWALLVNRTSQICFPHKPLPCHLPWVSGGIHLSTDRWIESGVSPQHILSYHRAGDNERQFHRWAGRTTGPHKHLHPWRSDKFWSPSFHLIFGVDAPATHLPISQPLPQLGGPADLGEN